MQRFFLLFCLLICYTLTINASEYPRQIADKAYISSEEMLEELAEEARATEVLNADANYRDMFSSVKNHDVNISRYVRPGEELKFQAEWKGLPAGSIKLLTKRKGVVRGRPVFVFELKCETNDFVASFYPVNTTINTYVDAKTGRSYLLRRRIAERKRIYKDRVEFEYDSRLPSGIPDPVCKYSFIDNQNTEVSQTPRPIPGNMQDVLSVVYYIRGLDLENEHTHKILLGGKNSASILTITVLREEEVNIPNFGKFDCLVLEPSGDGINRSANIFANRGEELIWVEKNTKIPLMMTAELPKPMGKVVATLVDCKNNELLKYKLSE